ncbi:MAG: class I SAM-dependent methyltransferase [Candidatus Diapherotrites archaeon]
MFFELKQCRVCGSADLEKYISLGTLPLANNLVDSGKTTSDLFFPLEVLYCKKCSLSQLGVVVDPEVMFSDYAYRTSISVTFQKHFAEMAEKVKEFFPNTKECFVVDIASNDGCMLQQFKKLGFKVLGVDPAKNLAKIAEEQGIPTLIEFWDEKVAERIINEKEKPKVVAASNVFAHVHDVHGFLKGVKKVLDSKGIFIVEFPYAMHLIEKNEFDTIYHEHLSYFLVKPLLELFESEKLPIFDIQEIPIHGGSIRVFAKHPENTGIKINTECIQKFLNMEKEKKLYSLETYHDFAAKSLDVKIAFLQMLAKLKKEKKKVAGYGAAAKASTLLNYCGIGVNYIDFIVDDAPTKQNKSFAGNRVPIVPSSVLEKENPDFLAIFAWTIAKELIAKTKEHQKKGGQYIIPLPFPKIVKNESEL